MYAALGYLTLFIALASGIFIAYEFHAYLYGFLVFWLGFTVGSMLIMKFKED